MSNIAGALVPILRRRKHGAGGPGVGRHEGVC